MMRVVVNVSTGERKAIEPDETEIQETARIAAIHAAEKRAIQQRRDKKNAMALWFEEEYDRRNQTATDRAR